MEQNKRRNKRTVGWDYEKIAGTYLEEHGYEILQYNFYCHAGEIDIIAMHEGYLVFVEVKYRKDIQKGYPLEAVSARKQRVIFKCALYYLQKQKKADIPVRFDVVGILGEEIQVIQNAFEFRL